MTSLIQSRARRQYKREIDKNSSENEENMDVTQCPFEHAVDVLDLVTDNAGNNTPINASNLNSTFDEDTFSEEEAQTFTSFSEDDEDSDESNNESNSFPHNNLAEALLLFYTKFNISRVAMNFLLLMLNIYGCQVPQTVYKLKLSKVNRHQTCLVYENNYCYFGIKNYMINLINNAIIKTSSIFNPFINIDGVSLFQSSRVSMWPILLKLKINSFNYISTVGIYIGSQKPSAGSLLKYFCDEINELYEGFSHKNIFIKFNKIVFVADMPANSLVLDTFGHCGYGSCFYCKVRGERFNGRTVFINIGEVRRISQYKQCLESNQNSPSTMLPLINNLYDIPVDPMHACYIGVTKKILKLYTHGLKGQVRSVFSINQKIQMNNIINKDRHCFPREFQRKPRTLENILTFKAVECRSYLLYLGPYVFKNSFLRNYILISLVYIL